MAVHLAVAGDVFDGVFFVLSFFPRDVLNEILDLIESVSDGFPTYSPIILPSKVCWGFEVRLSIFLRDMA